MSGFESEFVQWLADRLPRPEGVRLGVGDDMAGIDAPANALWMASDLTADGVHFDAREHAPERIGRKAVARNLSDCAAMAVRPAACTVSVAFPSDWSLDQARRLYEGMIAVAEAFGVAILGGDTTRWKHPLVIDVAILAAPYPRVAPARRDGARSGDLLCVTGPLGGSRLGRHLDFTPRVEEARRLAGALGSRLHAMIDISDGLSLDLSRICRASKVGACLEEDWLEGVVSDDARRAARLDGLAPLRHALSDGEDFELLLAIDANAPNDPDLGLTIEIVSPRGDDLGRSVQENDARRGRVAQEIEGRKESPLRLYPVGRVTPSGLSWRRLDGTIEPLEPQGYEHR